LRAIRAAVNTLQELVAMIKANPGKLKM